MREIIAGKLYYNSIRPEYQAIIRRKQTLALFIFGQDIRHEFIEWNNMR